MERMLLSKELKAWRIDRPDEWKMDDFIRRAERLELLVSKIDASDAGTEALDVSYSGSPQVNWFDARREWLGA